MPKVTMNHFNNNADELRKYAKEGILRSEIKEAVDNLTTVCHSVAFASGWWTDLSSLAGSPADRNVGEMLCLVHSEISEAMEGDRKNKPDDHLPHRPSIEVELADAIIRILDIGGGLNLDIGGALAEKLQYNCNRADHKLENRAAQDGKKY